MNDSVTPIAEKLSAEATRLAGNLDASEAYQSAAAISALMLAACVEGFLAGVSLETMLAGCRACWRDVTDAAERQESARECRKADDGTSN